MFGLPKRVDRKAYATVRFMAEALDPLQVTLALRLPYDHTHRFGEPRLVRTQKGQVREYSAYTSGQWNMSSEHWVDSPRLETHILWILEQLEPRADEVHGLLAGETDGDIFCFSSGSNSNPPSISDAVSQRVAALGLVIDIDHYEEEVAPD